MTDEPTLADAPKGIRVKPLVWEWVCEYGCVARAQTNIGTYSLHVDEDSASSRMLLYLHLTEDGDCTKYAIEVAAEYLDDDDMMSRAQADYEARIMPTLELAPADDKDATIARLTQEVGAAWDKCEERRLAQVRAEAKLAEVTAAGTYAQGIEAAKAACRAVGLKYAVPSIAATVADDCEEAVAALSPTPQADPVREAAKQHAVALEQCALFAGDAGEHIAKSMTEAAAFLRAIAQKEPTND